MIALGCAVAWWLGKRRGKPEVGDYSDAFLFIAFSFGFLLGLLQIFVTNHYSDARSQAQTEATTLVATYDDLTPFPQHVRTSAQHDLVCYMRSVVSNDWKQQEEGHTTEAPQTIALGDRVRNFRRTLPQTSPLSQGAYARVDQDVSDLGTARQQLLFLARPTVPTILWVVVFLSAAAVMFLAVSEYRSRPKIVKMAVVVALTVLLTFEIGCLVSLDRPFDPVARVEPNSLTNALSLLQAGRENNPVFRPCHSASAAS